MDGLKSKVISGFTWSMSGTLLSQMLQFGIGVILARLLSPRDFGLVAMVVVFTGFVSLLGDFGLGSALVQRREMEERHLSTAFWLNVTVGLVLMSIVSLGAPLISRFYGESVLFEMTLVMALGVFISSLNVVQDAQLRRRMDFRKLFWIDIATTVVSAAVAIAGAVRGYGPWSLVAQSFCKTVTNVGVMWSLSKWRPRLRFQLEAAKDLVGFSGGLLGFSIFHYWCRQADKLLVGRYVGKAALGEYSKAYGLMMLPVQQFSAIAGKVMFPALARLQHDIPRLREIYLRSTRAISLVTFPLLMGMIVTAKPLILALYGGKWAGVVPILQVLCLAGINQSVMTTLGWIYTALGRTDLMFKWGMFSSLVIVAGFWIGLRWGALGVAWAYVFIGYVVLFYPGWAVPGRLVGISVLDMLRNLAPCFCCALVMAGVVAGAGALLPEGCPEWVSLVLQVPLGVIVYWFLISRFRIAAYSEVCELLSERLVWARSLARTTERAVSAVN